MFEVKVTVEIPGLPEAIHALAGALSNSGVTAQNQADAKPVAYVRTGANQMATVPENGVIAGATPDPNANPTQVTANVPGPAATVADSAPAPTEVKAVTLDDLGRAGATLIDAGKMPQLIALLGKYGVQAVTQLKPEHFTAFADELRALGAKF